jgi:hypothetical protein
MHPISCSVCGYEFNYSVIGPAGPGCPRCGERIGPPGPWPPSAGFGIGCLAAVSGTILGALAAVILFLMSH